MFTLVVKQGTGVTKSNFYRHIFTLRHVTWQTCQKKTKHEYYEYISSSVSYFCTIFGPSRKRNISASSSAANYSSRVSLHSVRMLFGPEWVVLCRGFYRTSLLNATRAVKENQNTEEVNNENNELSLLQREHRRNLRLPLFFFFPFVLGWRCSALDGQRGPSDYLLNCQVRCSITAASAAALCREEIAPH